MLWCAFAGSNIKRCCIIYNLSKTVLLPRYLSINLNKGRNDKAEQGIRHMVELEVDVVAGFNNSRIHIKKYFEYFRPSTIIKTLQHPFNKSLDSIKIHRPNIRQTLSDVLASKNWSKKYVKQECDKNGKK